MTLIEILAVAALCYTAMVLSAQRPRRPRRLERRIDPRRAR